MKYSLMETRTKSKGTARFDTRLSKEQKELFEYAAKLGGYRTLTEFVIHSAQEKARLIVQEHQEIIKSERDREIFFNALLNPEYPNQKLLQAAEQYTDYIKKNEVSD